MAAAVTCCAQHYQPVDEKLGYCWKCLAQERDPLETGASWWWHLEPEVPEATQVEQANYWLEKVA